MNKNPSGVPNIPGLSNYWDTVSQGWNVMRQTWMHLSDGRLREMFKLGQKRIGSMFKMIYAEQLGVHPDGTKFTGRVSEADAKRLYGVDPEAYAMREQIDQDFKSFITEVERYLLADANRRLLAGSPELARRTTKIKADFAAMRKQPYFPLMRFGKYTITVRDASGNVERFEQYEKQHLRDKAFVELKRETTSDKRLKKGMMTDQMMAFQGMPPNLIEALKTNLSLTSDQEAALDLMGHALAPGQSFRKRMLKRANTAGFAEDGLRTYANYFFHGANHVARINYAHKLEEHILEIREQGAGLEDSTKLDGIRNMLQRHLKHIMEPANEWAGLRAWGFLWYLGFLPKAAFVNLTQIPLASYPYLAARYSDAEAVGELGRAIKDTMLGISRDKNLSAEDIELLEQLHREGKINQSLATELGAVANGTGLGKMLQASSKARLFSDIVGKGATLFSIAEQVNRRATAVASFRLATKKLFKPGSKFQGRSWKTLNPVERQEVFSEGLNQARTAIDTTQFEYSNWNRPDFMRGKKSVIFLFQLYMQNMLFFISRDPGSARLLGMLLFFAGLQGLPFAEDIADLLDTMFSTKNRKFDVRKEAREFIETLGMDPDLLLHGTSHYGFGMSWIGDQLGLPGIPEPNLSGSLSMGRVVPGFEALADLGGAAIGQPLPDFEHTLMDFQEGAAGALFAVPMNILRAFYYDSPYTWKRMELAMPSAARSISRSIRYATEGVETTTGGSPVLEFDLTDSKTQADIMLQSLGFSPTAVTNAQRQRAKMKEVEMFYTARRAMLLADYAYARQSGDPESIRGMLDAITQYNRDVPYREMGIKRSEISTSFKRRAANRRKAEHQLPMAERYIRLTRETGDAFER
jgi:hypothetical protein